MTQPQNHEWQERVLTDQELTLVLANLGSLEAMAVLQRQLELRALNRGNVGRVVDESFELSTAIPIVAETAEPEPVLEAITTSAGPAPTDIAESLNALFANRQRIEFSPTPALEITETPHTLVEPQAQLESRSESVSEAEQNLHIPPEADGNPVFGASNLDAYPPTEPGFLSSRAFAPAPPETGADDFVPSFSNPVPSGDSADTGEVTDSAQIESVYGSVESTTLEQPQVTIALGDAQQQVPAQTPLYPEEAAELPSAEEAVTAFEENYLTAAQPTLVDDVIFAVGGEIVSEPSGEGEQDASTEADSELPQVPLPPAEPEASVSASVPEVPVPTSQSLSSTADSRQYRSARSLLATWNGTGMLLVVASLGFVLAGRHISFVSAAAGAFAALVMSGFGFGAAALSARRGRQPQAVLSRAVFGVNGASAPLAVVILARLAATASISILAAQAIIWFFPSIPQSLAIAGYSVNTSIVIAVTLLIVASLTAGMKKAVRYVLVAIFAWTSILGAAITVSLGATLKPSTFSLGGGFDFATALAVASTLVILLGLIWGTSAADESVDLAPTTMVPKLIAASLLNFTIFGLLALAAGYAFAALAPAGAYNVAVGSVFTVIIAVSLANQMRRSTDAFRGFGLQKTSWWLLTLVLLVVAAAAATLQLLIPATNVLDNVNGILPVVGVPVLAWLSAIGVDSVLRRADYHEISLVRNYGFYGKIRVANLIGWLLATAVGWGFISSSVPGFGWLGYLGKLLGVSQAASSANMGLWLAIAIGMLTPLIFTVGAIRNQEAEGRALAERHQELIDVLGIAE